MGLTQVQVGDHFEVTDVTIHRWEKGKAPVKVSDFIKLAQLYRLDDPSLLMFHPDSAQAATALKEAAGVLSSISPEDRERWLDIGRRLAAVPLPPRTD